MHSGEKGRDGEGECVFEDESENERWREREEISIEVNKGFIGPQDVDSRMDVANEV